MNSEADLMARFDAEEKIIAQTRKLCELVDDAEACYKIRDGAQMALARGDD